MVGSTLYEFKKDEYETRKDFSGFSTDIKPIVIYTCSNTKEELCSDVQLAKAHGIYGFAMYYSSTEKNMLIDNNNALELIFNNAENDIPFLVIITEGGSNNIRRAPIINNQGLEGAEGDILCNELDIKDIQKFILDPRYIRIGGKPVIAVYNIEAYLDFRETVQRWRNTAREIGIGEIFIIVCNTALLSEEDLGYDIDGIFDLPPKNKEYISFEYDNTNGRFNYSYPDLVECERADLTNNINIDFFRGAMLGSKNSELNERRNVRWDGFSHSLFYLWIKLLVMNSQEHLPADRRFIFINSWNEPNDIISLKPNERYGYAALNALSSALFNVDYNFFSDNKYRLVGTGLCASCDGIWENQLSKSVNIAVQAHVYYTELIDEIVRCSNNIPFPFDLYISTDDKKKADYILKYIKKYSIACKKTVDVFENIGRDVIPFIKQMESQILDYKYLCHLHSKKSSHSDEIGEIWRIYLYNNLLGNERIIKEILFQFETNCKLGIVMAQNIDLLKQATGWGANKKLTKNVLELMGISYELEDEVIFPAGNMFWMRTHAIRNIFQPSIWDNLVPEELGQTDGTIMHAIERAWIYVSRYNGYSYNFIRYIGDNRPLTYSYSIDDFDYRRERRYCGDKTEENLINSVLIHRYSHLYKFINQFKFIKHHRFYFESVERTKDPFFRYVINFWGINDQYDCIDDICVESGETCIITRTSRRDVAESLKLREKHMFGYRVFIEPPINGHSYEISVVINKDIIRRCTIEVADVDKEKENFNSVTLLGLTRHLDNWGVGIQLNSIDFYSDTDTYSVKGWVKNMNTDETVYTSGCEFIFCHKRKDVSKVLTNANQFEIKIKKDAVHPTLTGGKGNSKLCIGRGVLEKNDWKI